MSLHRVVSWWSTYQLEDICCAYQVASGNSIRRYNQVTRNAYTRWLPGRFQLYKTCRDSWRRHTASFCLQPRVVYKSVASLFFRARFLNLQPCFFHCVHRSSQVSLAKRRERQQFSDWIDTGRNFSLLVSLCSNWYPKVYYLIQCFIVLNINISDVNY